MCTTCEETKPEDEKSTDEIGLYLKNLDTSVKPSDNFFRYANGGWMETNTIPAGYPSWNSFLHLHTLSQERLKEILENIDNKSEKSLNEVKLAAFYKAAMDEDAIEKDDTTSLKPIFDDIEACVNSVKNGDGAIAKHLGLLQAKYGISPFFSIYASPDYKKSEWSICHLAQGGLGLPDRDYYFDEDKADKRDLYLTHVTQMLEMLNVNLDLEPEQAARSIYDLEIKLANAHMTKTENRDPYATYNLTSINELKERCERKFDFAEFLLSATNKTEDELKNVNVRNTKAIEMCANVIASIEASVLRAYLLWNCVRSFAKYLSKRFVEKDFEFYEKILSGTAEMKPRWKRAMQFTESALGEALGEIYCQKFFDETCKEKALSIVEKVRQALENRLHEVEWMTSDETREQALKKMAGFKVKIG